MPGLWPSSLCYTMCKPSRTSTAGCKRGDPSALGASLICFARVTSPRPADHRDSYGNRFPFPAVHWATLVVRAQDLARQTYVFPELGHPSRANATLRCASPHTDTSPALRLVRFKFREFHSVAPSATARPMARFLPRMSLVCHLPGVATTGNIAMIRPGSSALTNALSSDPVRPHPLLPD